MSFSERAYHILLLAYPRHYQSIYAEPMRQLFRDRLREVRSISELLTLWVNPGGLGRVGPETILGRRYASPASAPGFSRSRTAMHVLRGA